MNICDVKDDPILTVPSQKPSTSSTYGLWGQGELKFGTHVNNHISWRFMLSRMTPTSSQELSMFYNCFLFPTGFNFSNVTLVWENNQLEILEDAFILCFQLEMQGFRTFITLKLFSKWFLISWTFNKSKFYFYWYCNYELFMNK